MSGGYNDLLVSYSAPCQVDMLLEDMRLLTRHMLDIGLVAQLSEMTKKASSVLSQGVATLLHIVDRAT